ncbi:MAG: glycosyltransferase family 39 protein, partial [Spirochaetaceae bacterium]|nr:glycosyltransferase family 39 protein [Spirochaetaceae bacterium]
MKKNLELVKNRLDISGKAFFGFAAFSAVFIAGCLVMMTPVFRDFLIALGGSLRRRPLNYTVWFNQIFLWGMTGIILYGVCFLVFFAKNIFRKTCSGKQVWLFLAAFIALGVCAIMFRANWTFSDDHAFIKTTAINKYSPPILSGGRFYPLGHIHDNIPLVVFRLLGIHSGPPPSAHYTLIALFFAVTAVCLYLLFEKIVKESGGAHPLFALFFACSFFVTGSAFPQIFMSLIFPETPLIMLFAVFMLVFYKARETDKTRYYIAAFLAAGYASYCKEPVFGAFLVIAVANYIFNFKNQSEKEKLFHAALIVNGIIFPILYYLLSYRNATGFYNEGRVASGVLRFIVSIFVKNPALILMYVFGFTRFLTVVFKKDRAHIFCDTLLFAGMAYVFAYILLRLDADYYFMPAIIFSMPSLVFWTCDVYRKNRNRALAAFGLLLILFTFNGRGVAGVDGIYRDRREFMPYISRLLEDYRAGKKFIWYESDNRISENTFYIAVRNWKKHIENAFLNFQNKT